MHPGRIRVSCVLVVTKEEWTATAGVAQAGESSEIETGNPRVIRGTVVVGARDFQDVDSIVTER